MFTEDRLSYLIGLCVVVCCGACSKGGDSNGKGDESKALTSPAKDITCVAATGLPDDIKLGAGAVVTKEENYAWAWNVDYELANPENEVKRMLAELEAKGWTTMSARNEDPDVSALAYKGTKVLHLSAPNVTEQNDIYLNYGVFPRNLSSIFEAVAIPPDAKLDSVEWTTTLHNLFVRFKSKLSAEEYKAEVESHLKSAGWTAAFDERDGTYKNSELMVTVGLRSDDDTLGVFLSDDVCKKQSYAGKYTPAGK